jgi:tetratricopeptide (TPR) repeat protein
MKLNRLLLVFTCVIALGLLVMGLAPATTTQTPVASNISAPEPPKMSTATRENNPNYPIRNPFYFEGKIDYELLGIDTPQNAWEFMQRGIYKQDDLEDLPGAKADYLTALSMNSLQNGTCQLVTTSPVPRNLTPAPCMFTLRSRLGYLLLHEDPHEAIRLFKEVLEIDPLRLEINALIGEAYIEEAEHTTDAAEKTHFYELAIEAFKAELALSPVTPLSIQLTGDEANNALVHWHLAEVYEKLHRDAEAAAEFDLYLKATKWHSDQYPWRIEIAKHKIEELLHH